MHSNRTPGKAGKIIGLIVSGILSFLAVGLFCLSSWYTSTFDMAFKELLLTLFSPLKGTGTATVSDVVNALATPLIVGTILYATVAVLCYRGKPICRRLLSWVCAIAFVLSFINGLNAFRIPEYLALRAQQTTVYEDYYVDASSVAITPTGEKKNLIYIYLESMETTYASQDVGGAQPENNYVENLTALANAEISFSNTEGLGGFESISGTAWTMGALVGTTTGVPFSISVFGEETQNSLGKRREILPGLTTLGDVLEAQGYTQEFLCGSNASFAGRDRYFTSHGNYKIYDLYTARANGDLPTEDYSDGWWGFEDFRLYEIAKKELTTLAASDKPFNFTMLTVDTHHVGGHICEKCGYNYDTRLGRVLDCADSLVSQFVAWCQAQDFYEDTVIIISGDHIRMDTLLTADVNPDFDRTVYNCFINTGIDKSTLNLTRRVWTSLDMYPTILGAMGFQIEGNRLGLGTNLFSDLPTLSERFGYDWLNREVNKYSEFYLKKFL